jgi:dihydrolipoamide dehydrogenase
VEKDRLGGTCLNRGCIPTKSLLRSAEVLQQVRRASEFGLEIDHIGVNLPQIVARKNKIVDGQVAGVKQLTLAGNISMYKGTGHIVSPTLVKVNAEIILTKSIIIATGSETALPPISGLDLPGVVTTDEMLDVTQLPQSLIVIGGNVVGMEFASIFNAFGTGVSILEMRPFLLESVDLEISQRFAQILRRQGITIMTSATVKAIRQEGTVIKVVWDTTDGERGIEAQMVLMATGRSPYTEGLGLTELGVKMKGRAIAVNERMETNIPNIYAIGDVIGGHMLAHVASYEGKIAVENALGRSCRVDYQAVPICVFTYPEIAGVGLTENEAKTRGLSYKVSRFPFVACGRAHTLGETTGMVKIVCEAESGRVLGVHIMGPHADDLIAEGVLAVKCRLTAKDIVDTMHAHPTLPEAVLEAALGQLGGSIHFRTKRVG